MDKYRTHTYQYQPMDQAENIANKLALIAAMDQMVSAPLHELAEAVRAGYAADARVNVTHPINELQGQEAVLGHVWQPLRRALPDVERRNSIVLGGQFRDANMVGCIGHYLGTFERDWLGIPATKGVVSVRFGEGHELQAGKIVRSYVFIDFLDLIRQAGFWPLAPSLGSEIHWPPPLTLDGVILTPQDNAVSQRSIERILRMHAALGQYSGQPPTREVLDDMEMVKHWHPNFMWYGPAGIGTTRGLKGFEDYHQIPFIVAFPDRGGSDLGHFIRIGDGLFAATGGWHYLQATHSGSDFLGVPPTGKRLSMRVMDFYRCDQEAIVENWIPFDIPHLLLQMGVDIFGRLRSQFSKSASMSDWLVAK